MSENIPSVVESTPNKGMRTFLIIWLGQLVSILGSGLSNFAVGVWIYDKTGQATPFALTILFGNLPRLLVMPYAGSMADRWNRRLVMILADTGSAVITVIMALLLWFGDLQVWHIYLLVSFGSIFSAFQQPAYMASVTMLVPKKDLARANGMLQMGQAIGSIVTPLLAGILFVAIQLKGIILLDLATYVIAVIPLLLVRIPQPKSVEEKEEGKKSAFKDFAMGWNFIKARSGLLGLLLYFAMVNFLLNFSSVLLVPMVLSVHSAAVLGILQTMAGAGMLIGGLIMSAWGGPKTRRIPKVIGFIAVSVLGFLAIGLGTSPIFPAAGMFFMLIFIPMASGTSMAVWQSKVPPEIQGRVFSVRAFIAGSMMPLAFLTAGPLADHVFEPMMTADGLLGSTFLGQLLGTGPGRGIGLMYVISGLAALLVSGITYANRHIRELENELPDMIPD